MIPVWIHPPLITVVPSSRPVKVTRPFMEMTWLAISTPPANSLTVLLVSPLVTDMVMDLAYWSRAEIFPSASLI